MSYNWPLFGLVIIIRVISFKTYPNYSYNLFMCFYEIFLKEDQARCLFVYRFEEYNRTHKSTLCIYVDVRNMSACIYDDEYVSTKVQSVTVQRWMFCE